MRNDNVVQLPRASAVEDVLTEVLRAGAQHLLSEAIEAEVEEFLAMLSERRTGDGRAAVVRNGYLPQRAVLTGIGPVPIEVPKVRSRDAEPAVFRSALVPPYVRRSKSIDVALPWLYLHGVSTNNMGAAVAALVGPKAANLSAPVVARLKKIWSEEYAAFRKRRWDQRRIVYLWADGVYSGLRAEEQKLCALVVIGADAQGRKHMLALEDGVRESTQSWREVLQRLKKQGLVRPPLLAAGDGALGFWAALDEVFPQTHQQRCWVHKIANVLNYAPKAVQPKMKEALAQIWMAETRNEANQAFDEFIATFGAKYPKAVECLRKDRPLLLTFFDFPAAHWQHIRSTNVIESVFATVRHRTDRVKGCFTRDSLLALMFKLGEAAQKTWRKLRGYRQCAAILDGVKFKDGVALQAKPPKPARNQITQAAA